jgi:hypothetical protein
MESTERFTPRNCRQKVDLSFARQFQRQTSCAAALSTPGGVSPASGEVSFPFAAVPIKRQRGSIQLHWDLWSKGWLEQGMQLLGPPLISGEAPANIYCFTPLH